MATTKTVQSRKLQISVEAGVLASGATSYKTLTFSSVNPALGDDDARLIAAGYANLQPYPTDHIALVETSYLTESI